MYSRHTENSRDFSVRGLCGWAVYSLLFDNVTIHEDTQLPFSSSGETSAVPSLLKARTHCLSKYHQEKSIIQKTQVTISNSFLLSVFSGSCFCYSYCISGKSVHMPAWKTEKRPIMDGSREPYATWEQLSPTFSPRGENREYINRQQPLTKGLCISNQSSL